MTAAFVRSTAMPDRAAHCDAKTFEPARKKHGEPDPRIDGGIVGLLPAAGFMPLDPARRLTDGGVI